MRRTDGSRVGRRRVAHRSCTGVQERWRGICVAETFGEIVPLRGGRGSTGALPAGADGDAQEDPDDEGDTSRADYPEGTGMRSGGGGLGAGLDGCLGGLGAGLGGCADL